MSTWKCLIFIFLTATIMRFHALGRASFWYDEFGSLEASTGRGLAQLQLPVNLIITDPPKLTSLDHAPPAWKIWTSLDLDNHPPLYFLVLRLTRVWLGDSEWAVRLPSAIFSILALLFFYLIIRTQLAHAASLWASGLMAVAGSQIALAQEARSYTLFLLLCLIAGWLVLRIERLGFSPRRWLVLGLIAWASLLAHYLSGCVLISLLIYSAIRLRGDRRWTSITAIISGMLLFAGSWGPFFLRQLATAAANNAWQYDDNPRHLPRLIWHLIQLPTRWLSEPASEHDLIVILICAVCLYSIHRCRRQNGFFFWLLWGVPLILLIAFTDITRHAQSLFFMRYTFAAAPALFFLAGAFSQNVRIGWLLPAALSILCITTLPSAYSKVFDWRNVANDLQQRVAPGDTIIFTPGNNDVSWSQSTFLGLSHYAPNLPASILILTQPSADLLRQAFRPGHMTWVICTDPRIPPNALDPSAQVIRNGVANSFGSVSELKP